MRSIEVLNVINGKTLETNEIVKFEGLYKVRSITSRCFSMKNVKFLPVANPDARFRYFFFILLYGAS